ncbi:hypothetical protein K8T06_05650 [bacterium]|nr:hypothetical protein [bacterium]
MSALVFLDVIIGMIFIYGILSLACTAANELLINGLGNLRARILNKGIINLLRSDESSELLEQFYKHPLIRSLHKPNKKPSYIPNKYFAISVLDQYIDIDDQNRVVLRDQTTIDKLPESIQTMIKGFIKRTNGGFEDLLAETEEWFVNATDRMEGWYKRRLKVFGIIIAAIVTIGVNANSLDLMKHLYLNPDTRSQIIQAAEEIQQQSKLISPKEKEYTNLIKDLESVGLPLGWGNKSNHDKLNACELVVNKFLGWLITIFAVSLGAPFWFDLLSRFMKIRSVGTKVKLKLPTTT